MTNWTSGLLLFLAFAATRVEAVELVLALGVTNQDSFWPKVQEYIEAIGKEADPHLKLKLKHVPYQRSPELVQRGEIDGDVARLAEVYEDKPEVLRVPEPMASLQLAIVYNKEAGVQDLAALRKQKSAAMAGNQLHARACEALGLSCVFMVASSSPIDMLRLKRVGSLLATQLTVNLILNDPRAKSFTTLTMDQPYKESLYMFLHPKHKNWVGPISQAIRKIKENGTFRRIMQNDP